MPKSKIRKKKKPQKREYIKTEKQFKMSEVILDYVSPFLRKENLTEKQKESAVEFGIIIWNVASLPEEDIENYISEFIEDFKLDSELTEEEIYNIIDMMIQRRKQQFGHIRRFIVGYDIRHDGMQNILNISSTEI